MTGEFSAELREDAHWWAVYDLCITQYEDADYPGASRHEWMMAWREKRRALGQKIKAARPDLFDKAVKSLNAKR